MKYGKNQDIWKTWMPNESKSPPVGGLVGDGGLGFGKRRSNERDEQATKTIGKGREMLTKAGNLYMRSYIARRVRLSA